MGDVFGGQANRPIQVRRERRNGFSVRKRKLFLERLAATCNVRKAAQAAAVSHRTPYLHRRTDEAFAAQWDEALAIGYQRLEEAVLRHAMEGMGIGELDLDAGETPENRVLSTADVQLYVRLMDRHRAAVEGRRVVRSSRRYTAEETDAALCKQLDALAAKLRRAS